MNERLRLESSSIIFLLSLSPGHFLCLAELGKHVALGCRQMARAPNAARFCRQSSINHCAPASNAPRVGRPTPGACPPFVLGRPLLLPRRPLECCRRRRRRRRRRRLERAPNRWPGARASVILICGGRARKRKREKERTKESEQQVARRAAAIQFASGPSSEAARPLIKRE